MTSPRTGLDRFYKASVGLLAALLVVFIMLKVAQFLLNIVVLVGVAILVTYILLAPVEGLENLMMSGFNALLKRRPQLGYAAKWVKPKFCRITAILMVYLAVVISMLFVGVRFIPVLTQQGYEFTSHLPQYVERGEDWLLSQPFAQSYFHKEVNTLRSKGALSTRQAERLEHEMHQNNGSKSLSPTEKQVVREKVFALSEHINSFVKTYLGGAFSNLFRLIGTTLAGFVYTITGLVLVFYFLLDAPKLKDGFLDMLPQSAHRGANYILSNMHGAMFGFIKGQVILGMATGLYMIIVYSLFGVPYAFLLGAFFAVSEIIPVVGTWLGFTPGILVLLFLNPIKLLFVMGLVYVFQVIKDNMVAPRIIGQVMGLHPVIVILSLLICAQVAGFVGVLFAIPIASMVNVLIRFFQELDNEQPSA